MSKGVQPKTLQIRCNVWAKRLRLSDWTITCKYATKGDMDREDPEDNDKPYFDDETIGHLMDCSLPEKIAVIGIRKNYYDHDGFGISWNLDTLILHELIHIIERLAKSDSAIPGKVRDRADFKNYEEFICDCFASVIYYNFRKKI